METHFWWPNLPSVRNVPSDQDWRDARTHRGNLQSSENPGGKVCRKYASRMGMKLLSASEHHELCTNAGYSDVQVIEERDKGWIYCTARKP